MLQLSSCLKQHEPWMLALAVLSCAAGCYAAFAIGMHAVLSREVGTRLRWGAVSLLVTGNTIWSTHFIATIAFHVPFPSGFDLWSTVTSLAQALAIAAAAGSAALFGRGRKMATLAGVLTGLAITAIHITGMSAYRVMGTVSWDPLGLALGTLIACTCAALAGALSWNGRHARVWIPSLLLTLAIGGGHFVAMSATTIDYDPSVALPGDLLTGDDLSPIVVAITALVMFLMLLAYRLHLDATRRIEDEQKRFQEFAEFSVEGLLICTRDRIVWANHSIETMTGQARHLFVDRSLEALFAPSIVAQFSPEREVDAVLGEGDDPTPVRVITKSIVLGKRPHLVVAVRDQRERLRAEVEMRRLADTDPLTGLANRSRFNEMLERLLASRRTEERSFALLSLDLDRFKQVNDVHGHGSGDALLMRVAGRLAAVVREGHLVARLGGDEFSVIATQTDGPEGARALADRIVEVLSRPYLIDGLVHDIATSVGVVLAPADGETATTLVRNADLALYRAKDEGGNAYRMFEAGMDARMQARRALELALRRAAARQEFEVYYQPQVDARTGQYTGAEALIRWNDPQRGVILPSEFIGIAEETNLIASIGEWVLRTACAQAMSWPAHFSVAVNLSPKQFRDPRLASIVASALDESGLPGHRLELEITESVLIEDEVGVLAILEHFRELGVRISLDDFGTGYSSLGHLRRFPFDKIKIDRSFVSRATEDSDSAAIVRAIVSLGSSLGIATTAEGVETAAQRRFVTDEGCDQIQGYLFSKPVQALKMPAAFHLHPQREDECSSSDCFTVAIAS